MGVKTKTKVNKMPQMIKEYSALGDKKIQVGVLGEQAWLAGIHEYGCNIEVTDRMRAWLHRNGLHIKASTKAIHIPERSFLRSGYDTNQESVLKSVDRLIGLVGHGMTVNDFCETIGELLADEIKNYAVQLSDPPKHPFTLMLHPDKTNPLVQSGDMIGAIAYRVE